MPVRKIPPNRRSLTGMVASRKNERMVASESSLERDLLVRLEFDPVVERYEEQPVCIQYNDDDGRQHTYTPDVLIYYRADILPGWSPLLCEVKYRANLLNDWKEIKPKVRAGRFHARQHGWRFKIFTEHEIRTPYLENAKFLRPYRRVALNEAEARLILDALDESVESDPEQLLTRIHQDPFKRAELLPTLWRLVSDSYIGVDLNQPLTMRSHLWDIQRRAKEAMASEQLPHHYRAWVKGRGGRSSL